MGRREILSELALDPRFRALSPAAKEIVIGRRLPEFEALSDGARRSVVDRFETESVRTLGTAATPRGALDALGIPVEPPGMLERAREWAGREDVSNLRGQDIVADDRGDPVVRGPVRREYRGTIPGLLSAATGLGFDSMAEDLRRGPAAMMDRASIVSDEVLQNLAAGTRDTYAAGAHTLANAVDLATPEPILSPEEFDDFVAKGAWPEGTPPDEIDRRRREFTEPSAVGGYMRGVSNWLRDYSQGQREQAEEHRQSAPTAQGLIEPTSTQQIVSATIEATPAAAGMVAELTPFMRIARMANPNLAGPVGMAAHGAVSRSDEGLEAAGEGAAHGAALGGAMTVLERSGATEAIQRLGAAGVFGGDAFAAGAAQDDVIAAALTGAALITPRHRPGPPIDPRLTPQEPTAVERAGDFADAFPRAVQPRIADPATPPPPPAPQLPAGSVPRERAAAPPRPPVIELGTGREPSREAATPEARFEAEIARIWGSEGFERPVDPLSINKDVARRIHEREQEATERAVAEGADIGDLGDRLARVYEAGEVGPPSSEGLRAPAERAVQANPPEALTPPPAVKKASPRPVEGLREPELEARGDVEALGRGEHNLPLMETGEKLAPASKPTEPARDPIRRDDILAEFTQAIGKPIFQAGNRPRMRGKLGYRLNRSGAIRTKNFSDLEVTAHELAHELDSRYPEVEKLYKGNSPASKEMLTTSYDTSLPSEGFAEFVRLYMTQRPAAREVVPEAVRWFEKDFLPKHPELQVPLERASDQMHAWFDQSALDQARSKVGTMRDVNERKWWRRLYDSDLRQTIVDDLEGIKRFETLIRGEPGKIGDDGAGSGAYRTARLTRAKHSVTSGALEFGAPVWAGTDPAGNRVVAKHVRGTKTSGMRAAKAEENAHVEYEGKGLLKILNQVEGLDVRDIDGRAWSDKGARLARSGRGGSWRFSKADKLDAYLLYAIGRRAELLKQQGRENLFTGQQIADMVRLGETNPEFPRILDEYQAYNRKLLDFAEAAGVVNPESREAFETDVYLPFYREKSASMKMLGHGDTPGDASPIKRLTGGTANLRDVLDNMLTNASLLIDAAMTNRARQKIAELAEEKGAGDFIEPITKESKRVLAHEASVRKQLFDELGWENPRESDPYWTEFPERLEVRQAMENLGPVLSLVGPTPPRGDRVIAVLNNGKARYYDVLDDQLYRSVLSLNRTPANWVINALGKPAQLGKTTIVLSPDFMMANLARDTVSSWVYSKHGFKPIVDTWRGMKSRMSKDDAYKQFLANGGGFSGYYLDEAYFRRHQADLTRFYKQKGVGSKTVMSTPQRMADFARNLGDSIEMSARIGEFKRATAQGEHPQDAAFDAREVGGDFAMRGDRINAAGQAANFFYDTVMFLKPAIIGLDRSYRGVSQDPHRRQVAARVGATVAAGLGLFAWAKGDPMGLEDEELIPEWDRMDSLEDWDRDGHFHIYSPTPSYIAYLAGEGPKPPAGPGGAYQHWRMPKPFEVGAMSSVAERGLDAFLQQASGAKPGTEAFEDLSQHVLRILRDQVRLDPMPTGVEGLAEVAMNRDRFTGRPIESISLERLEKWRKSSGTGSRVLRKAGEATRNMPDWAQLNPAVAEHLVTSYLNYWGTYGLTLADKALFADVPDLEPAKYPGVRRFYKGKTVMRTRQLRELGDAIRESDSAMATARSLVRENEVELAREILKRPEAPLYQLLQQGPKPMLMALSQMRRGVQVSKDLEELQGLAQQLVKSRGKKAGTFSLQAMKRDGAWDRLSSVKSAVLNEIRFQETQIAARFATMLEKEKVK